MRRTCHWLQIVTTVLAGLLAVCTRDALAQVRRILWRDRPGTIHFTDSGEHMVLQPLGWGMARVFPIRPSPLLPCLAAGVTALLVWRLVEGARRKAKPAGRAPGEADPAGAIAELEEQMSRLKSVKRQKSGLV